MGKADEHMAIIGIFCVYFGDNFVYYQFFTTKF